jgi:hypothetical protein
MNRRALLAAFALALAEVRETRATGTDRCNHDHQCAEGEECVNGACVPRTIPCEDHSQCAERHVCMHGACCTVVPYLGTVTQIVYVPVTVAGGGKRRKRRRRKKR